MLRIFFIGLILVIFSSCNQLADSDAKILKMNLGSEPPTLDWNLANDSTSFDIISNIMVGLTRFAEDSNGNIIVVPGVAKEWKINQQADEYFFYLDENAVWMDDRPVIAQEFIDSFKRMQDPNTAAPYAQLLNFIDLEQSKAVDERTLFIKLKKPAAYFIYLTAYGLTLPIRKDLIDAYGKNWTEPQNLITNGPFFLKEWRHEYKIVLKRSKNFHLKEQGENLVEELKYFMVQEQSSAYNLFQNNQLDWIDNRSIPLSAIRKIQQSQSEIEKTPLLRNTYVGFNHKKVPFDKVEVRKAFALAIDRDTLVKVLGKGDLANNTWIPSAFKQYIDYDKLLSSFNINYNQNASLLEYQRGYFPELARKHLESAGYPNGKNFPQVEFLIPNKESSKILAETLQSMWYKELNVKVKIITMEWKVFLATLQANPSHIFRLNWGADYPDPDTFMQLFTKNNQINYGAYSSDAYDALVDQAGTSIDINLRKELYSRAETILTQEDVAIIPLFIDSQTILKKNYVQNLRVNAMDITFLDKVSISGENALLKNISKN